MRRSDSFVVHCLKSAFASISEISKLELALTVVEHAGLCSTGLKAFFSRGGDRIKKKLRQKTILISFFDRQELCC